MDYAIRVGLVSSSLANRGISQVVRGVQTQQVLHFFNILGLVFNEGKPEFPTQVIVLVRHFQQ